MQGRTGPGTSGTGARSEPDPFRHEALLYSGESEFLRGTVPFIRDALEREEPILVVVGSAKIRALRDELGDDGDGAYFADMEEVGRNPARIIPAWRDFVTDHRADGRIRGIGEPIVADRSPEEVVECQRHEELLNVAFAGGDCWWLVCPYDTATLDPSVIEEARRSHPFVWHRGEQGASTMVRDLNEMASPCSLALAEPEAIDREFAFASAQSLPAIRRAVREYASAAGLDESQLAGMVLAVDEVAANSVRHGGGAGVLRLWCRNGRVVCEIRDRGRMDDPLAGRERPAFDRVDGRGLWLANQVCDLVQLRTFPTGNVVRLHVRRHADRVELTTRIDKDFMGA